MNILFTKHFFVEFMVSEIPRVSVFGYFPLHSLYTVQCTMYIIYIYLSYYMIHIHSMRIYIYTYISLNCLCL